jgi:hypothetical protein
MLENQTKEVYSKYLPLNPRIYEVFNDDSIEILSSDKQYKLAINGVTTLKNYQFLEEAQTAFYDWIKDEIIKETELIALIKFFGLYSNHLVCFDDRKINDVHNLQNISYAIFRTQTISKIRKEKTIELFKILSDCDCLENHNDNIYLVKPVNNYTGLIQFPKGYRYLNNIQIIPTILKEKYTKQLNRGENNVSKYFKFVLNDDNTYDDSLKTGYEFLESNQIYTIIKKQKYRNSLWTKSFNVDTLDPNKDRVSIYLSTLADFVRNGNLDDIKYPFDVPIGNVKTIVVNDVIEYFNLLKSDFKILNKIIKLQNKTKVKDWLDSERNNPLHTKRVQTINSRKATKALKIYLRGLNIAGLSVIPNIDLDSKFIRHKHIVDSKNFNKEADRVSKCKLYSYQVRLDSTLKSYLDSLPLKNKVTNYKKYSLQDIIEDFFINKYPRLISNEFYDFVRSNRDYYGLLFKHGLERETLEDDSILGRFVNSDLKSLVAFKPKNIKEENLLAPIVIRFLESKGILETEKIPS